MANLPPTLSLHQGTVWKPCLSHSSLYTAYARRRKAPSAVAQLHISCIPSVFLCTMGPLERQSCHGLLAKGCATTEHAPALAEVLVLAPLFDERPFHILTVTEVTRDIKELLE